MAATTDGFALSRVDLSSAARATCSAPSQSGRRSSLRLLSVLRDEDVIAEARGGRDRAGGRDPELAGHPALAAPDRGGSSTRTRPSSWSKRVTRIDRRHRRGPPAADAARGRDPAHLRPGARGAVLRRESRSARCPGCVLDLYAGSGAVGLEALSAGPGWSRWWSRTGAPPR